MPKKTFGPDDILHNTVKTYPQYSFSYYFNNSYINNRPQDGLNVQNGFISLYEINVNREVGHEALVYPFLIKNESVEGIAFKNVSGTSNLSFDDWKGLAQDHEISSSYPATSSLSRERLIGDGSGPTYTSFDIIDGVSERASIHRLLALEVPFNYNKIYSTKYDFKEYYVNGNIDPSKTNIEDVIGPHQKYMTMFSFPGIFIGDRINPGSIELNFYVTGTLVATAKDTRRNGELVETFGPSSSANTVIGTVSYTDGVMLITGNYNLNDTVEDGYLCPVTGTATTTAGPGRVVLQSAWRDNPKWAHFGANQSFIKSSDSVLSQSYGPVSSSYDLKFEGTNIIPTLTMFAHADKNELNWSNNLTYLDRESATGSTYHKIVVAETSSLLYAEDEELLVKNTISSSFANYSSSYQDQTFISKINIYDEDDILIGTAKLAKPVTKTNSTDYTFKLKIDI